jgi:hypothetical protein
MAFEKGQSGNPNGRPKAISLDEIRNIARRKAPGMVDLLARIAEDEEQPAAARVAAANHVLDRAYGKPPQSLADEDGNILEWVALLAERRSKALNETIQ